MIASLLSAFVAPLSLPAVDERETHSQPSSAQVAAEPAPTSPWTHTLRLGPSAFAAAGDGGSCEYCFFPTASFMAGGTRFDYVLQKGHSNIRWHNIASIELGWGTHRQPTHQDYCGQSPGCTCVEADCDGTDAYNGLQGALFLGTGFRVDTAPSADSAFVFELDGTVGASTAPHVGLIGLHLAAGSRVAKKWEILVSAEADVLWYGHASASLVIGRSL